jgi:hypothetical protein
VLRELRCQVSRIESFFVGKMTACEFKITPQFTRTTRIQRQPENHRAHLKIRHVFPGDVQHTGRTIKTRPGSIVEEILKR